MLGYDFQDMLSAIYDDWGETEQALLIAGTLCCSQAEDGPDRAAPLILLAAGLSLHEPGAV